MSASRNPRRWVCAILAVGGLFLVLAATMMPWATHKDLTSGVTVAFRGGRPGVLLVILGLATLATVPVLMARSLPSLYRVPLVCGVVALVVSIGLALRDISAANRVTETGPSATSYAVGAGIAIAASFAIAVASLIELADARRPEPSLA